MDKKLTITGRKNNTLTQKQTKITKLKGFKTYFDTPELGIVFTTMAIKT